jgi:hypothetical protein
MITRKQSHGGAAAPGAGLMAVLVLGLALSLASCQQERKVEPVPVGELVEYRDPAIGFSISYPKAWIVDAQVTRARFFSRADVDRKFLDPTGPYPNGAKIAVDVIRTTNAAGTIAEKKSELAQIVPPKFEYKVTVAGKESDKLVYSARYSAAVEIHSHHVFVPADTFVYHLAFEGFNEEYAAHEAIFDTALATFRMPKAITPGRDATLPAESFADAENQFFSFKYPENFNFTSPAKGRNDLVVGLRGVRLDCGIQFDVFGAQGLTLEKVFDQNKNIRGATHHDASVAGKPAKYLAYAPTRDVERRIYFLVHNDKVIRITLDWYRPQRTEYLAAYDQVLQSIRLK